MVAGVDCGYAHCGLALVMAPERVVAAADVLVTEPDPKVAEEADVARRIRELTSWLAGVLTVWKPDSVVLEWPRARGKGHLGAIYGSWGACLASLAFCVPPGTPVTGVHQLTWKRHVSRYRVGRSVPDDVLYPALEAISGGAVESHLAQRRVLRGNRHHALDALGIAHWAIDQGRG